jgi:hypothetical protein
MSLTSLTKSDYIMQTNIKVVISLFGPALYEVALQKVRSQAVSLYNIKRNLSLTIHDQPYWCVSWSVGNAYLLVRIVCKCRFRWLSMINIQPFFSLELDCVSFSLCRWIKKLPILSLLSQVKAIREPANLCLHCSQG